MTTNTITQVRHALAAHLSSELTDVVVHDHVPDQLTGLDVVLQPADDYLRDAGTLAGLEFALQIEIHVLVTGEDNNTVHDLIDSTLARLAPAIASARWEDVRCSGLGTFSTSEWTAYGVALTARTYITLR